MDFILIRSVLAGVSRRNPHAGSASGANAVRCYATSCAKVKRQRAKTW